MDDMTDAMQSETDKARLRSEIADLKRDLAAIAKTLSDKGIEILEDITDGDRSTLDEIRDRGQRAAIGLGYQARKIANTPTQNSVSTLIIIAGLGVIIGMLAAR
jgi:ElaB/YqjD/DUF883 family membrane-anchored ribosome-binding protein